MNITTITNIIAGTAKFDSLTIVENGLILKNGKRAERTISFSELDNIYIKSYKLNPLFEFAFILFPFLFVFLSIQFLPFEMVLLVALFTVVPVFIKVYNYRWYRLKVCLKDGTFFIKKVSLRSKSETISIVNSVKKEGLYYKTNAMAHL
ncbi:hypothetical protein [Flavobacterium cellulosilyticum]|uniref:Uncharacterized protein n=1 Tax=Flavobacterium cellulosilyticum TaxID=2541731 RepID=A0A4R5CFX8_9FLAO|nr:hypothetical protein [Flavobacterium cellulosilyticum]TDD98535.1 hypothetical protein E0F76_05240 [Flavobacterium cellulosilyticum]